MIDRRRPRLRRSQRCAPKSRRWSRSTSACRPIPTGPARASPCSTRSWRSKPDTKVIVASGHGARESALDAIARGAYDFYQKPVDIEAARADRPPCAATAPHRGREPHARGARRRPRTRVLGSLITGAPEMVRVARTIERVANTNVSVMLLGRQRHRQGAAGPRAARGERPPGRAVRRDQLRGDPREPARKRAVRPREGRVHRGGQDHRGQDRAGRRRHAVPRRGRRHAAATSRSSCCASCRSG